MPTVINEICQLFQRFGGKYYGENCTQLMHAISTGENARSDNASQAIVVASFLHDIDHFLADESNVQGFTEFGHPNHSEIAANWLDKHGFPDSVTQPIRYHVCAKRYLQRSHNKLSSASFATLSQQGGSMTESEAAAFESNDYFNDAIQLRKYDDLGKPTYILTDDIDSWLKRVEAFYLVSGMKRK